MIAGFPSGSEGKEFACSAGDLGSFNPWVGKIPWRRKWQPTQEFLPGKSLDRGAWQATVHGVAKSQDTTKQPHFTSNDC